MSSLKVLVVCTANRCRSPIGEVVLAAALREQGVDASVESAGLLDGGWPAEAEAVEAVSLAGLDLSAHSSRQLSAAIVDDADLILTMERMHVREIAVRFGGLAKAFTIKDFVRRTQAAPRSAEESMVEWLVRLNADRDKSTLLGRSSDDEVDDPIGKPLADFVRTRDELQGLCGEVAKAVGGAQ